MTYNAVDVALAKALGGKAAPTGYHAKKAAAEAALADGEDQLAKGHYDRAAHYYNEAFWVAPKNHVGLYRRMNALAEAIIKAERKGLR
jgi:hypothetical protein